MTVSLGPGLTHKPPERRAQYKGISANRRDYDRRRRLNTDSSETTSYKRLIRRDPCWICGQPAGQVQDVDHITPLSLGGQDDWTNMSAACAPCNRGRRERPLLDTLLRARRG